MKVAHWSRAVRHPRRRAHATDGSKRQEGVSRPRRRFPPQKLRIPTRFMPDSFAVIGQSGPLTRYN